MTFCKRKKNYYNDNTHTTPKIFTYSISILSILVTLFLTLRDTTPITFIPPSHTDLNLERGDLVNSDKINDVYWRVSIRHISSVMSNICNTDKYTILTHKNINIDNDRMKESYIYLCSPIDNIKTILNARAVISGSATSHVRCVESYGNLTKTVTRKYPFSLKYVCGETFVSKTRIIRDAKEACTLLHAIDIVESVWD
jgi:hypothetical protein